MNSNPVNQLSLYGHNFEFFNFIKLYKCQKLPNKILLSGEKGIGKSTLAYHIINYVLSKNEDYSYNDQDFVINENNRSFKLVKNNTSPNFYLISLKKEKKILTLFR